MELKEEMKYKEEVAEKRRWRKTITRQRKLRRWMRRCLGAQQLCSRLVQVVRTVAEHIC